MPWARLHFGGRFPGTFDWHTPIPEWEQEAFAAEWHKRSVRVEWLRSYKGRLDASFAEAESVARSLDQQPHARKRRS